MTGAAAKNPQRFRNRSEPKTSKKPVGAAPAHLSAQAKGVWKELAADLGWLKREDRLALEVACVALGSMRGLHAAGEPVTGALISAANTAVGKLGASPTDRGKVFQPAPDDDADDPFAALDGKPN